MKRLSLAQPTVLLMVGVPGAGKSFFARQFAEHYALPCVSSDRIRHELFNESRYSSGEQDIVNRMTEYGINELLKSGSTFVVDGTFGNVRTQRLNLERRAREKGYRVLAVWVQVDAATARMRSERRNPKKRDDQYNKPLPAGVFETWSKQLTAPSSEDHVVISGKHTFPAQHRMVLRKLAAAQTFESEKRPPTEIKVVTPTPERHIGKPTPRPENRRIIIS